MVTFVHDSLVNLLLEFFTVGKEGGGEGEKLARGDGTNIRAVPSAAGAGGVGSQGGQDSLDRWANEWILRKALKRIP